MVVTRNGEAKAIILSIREYERTKETLALLKMISLAGRDIEAGRTISADEAFEQVKRDLRAKYG